MASRRLRWALMAAACVLLTGFAQVRDTLVVHGDGTATVTRVVVMRDWDRWPALAGEAGQEARARREALARLPCEVAREAGWQACERDGNTLTLSRDFAADDVSGSERGRAYLALHRYLAAPTVRPMFTPPLLGLDDGEANRAAIASLRRLGFRHTLVVRMPGDITRLWGREVEGMGDSLTFDLMDTPPAFDPTAEHDTFIESRAGWLHGRWTALLALGALGVLALWAARALRR